MAFYCDTWRNRTHDPCVSWFRMLNYYTTAPTNTSQMLITVWYKYCSRGCRQGDVLTSATHGPVGWYYHFFIESFPQICFEGKWLQNRLRADKKESRSLLAVDVQGHQRGGFCIRRWISASSSISLKCALRASGCRIGYEPTKRSRDHFRRSMSRDTNVEVSALGVGSLLHRVFP